MCASARYAINRALWWRQGRGGPPQTMTCVAVQYNGGGGALELPVCVVLCCMGDDVWVMMYGTRTASARTKSVMCHVP